MISERKLAANRANARASTGPKTAAGKAHSARNAMRHGLSAATWTDPAIARAIEQVGCRLAGRATGEERALAYAVAAAQVDLARAREAGRKVCAEPCIAAALARSPFPPGTPAAAGPDDDPAPLEELLSDAVYELEAVKRYEGRAFARRQRAIRALDAKRTGEEPPPRRLSRPRGLRLPRWRLPNPNSRVIRFAGLPRWAWWRPDPLDEEPKRRRARRRKAATEVPGELELLVSPALLARPLASVPHALAPREGGLPAPERPTLPTELTLAHDSFDQREGAQTPDVIAETETSNTPRVDDSRTGKGLIEELRKTNPPPAGAAGSEQTPPAVALSTSAPPADPPLTQHLRETKPWRRGATPTPLPTCRVGPCRWVGEVPADHWSYRGWRYRRAAPWAGCFGPALQIDPIAGRCRGAWRGRSRAPP